MWVVHLINKIDPRNGGLAGLTRADELTDDGNLWYTCCWDFKLDEAKKLVGGMIFLHREKKKPADKAGKVLKVWPIDLRDKSQERYFPHVESMGLEVSRPQRVRFLMEMIPVDREMRWRGQDHDRSWTSGIIEV